MPLLAAQLVFSRIKVVLFGNCGQKIEKCKNFEFVKYILPSQGKLFPHEHDSSLKPI